MVLGECGTMRFNKAHDLLPLVLGIVAGALAGGCSTYQVSPYALTVTNVQAFRALGSTKVKVAQFTGDETASKNGTGCRAVGPINTPSGRPFFDYIQGALSDELRVAGLYDDGASLIVKGRLTHLDLRSSTEKSIDEGDWKLTLLITVGGEPTFTIEHKYKFESSFWGEKACALSAQAFMPAIQSLMRAIANHPTFQKALSTRSGNS